MNESRLPPNFSWITDELAGSAHPGWSREGLKRCLEGLKEEGINLVVSLSPVDNELVSSLGLAHLSLRVPDMGIPDVAQLASAIDHAKQRLARGEKILVHCGAGYGRTGTFLACLLVSQGMAAREAIRLVRCGRPGSIETRLQEEFIRAWGERKP